MLSLQRESRQAQRDKRDTASTVLLLTNLALHLFVLRYAVFLYSASLHLFEPYEFVFAFFVATSWSTFILGLGDLATRMLGGPVYGGRSRISCSSYHCGE